MDLAMVAGIVAGVVSGIAITLVCGVIGMVLHRTPRERLESWDRWDLQPIRKN